MKINSKSSLKSFFEKHGSNSHVMMAVIISHTPDIIKNMIISFMKTKADIYKNVYFLIYAVDEQDISNIANNFPTKKSDYPYIIYMYDNSDKLLDVSAVTTIKALRESFSVVEADYEDTLNIPDSPLLTPNSKNNSSNTSNQSDNNVFNGNRQYMSKNQKKSDQDNNEQLNENEQYEEEDYLEENKKLADKILLFMEYKKDYDAIFIKDIQRRKKLEKKTNNEKTEKTEKSNERIEQNNKKNNNNSSKKKK